MNLRILPAAFPLLLLALAPPAHAVSEFSETRLIVKFRARPDVVERSPGMLESGSPALDGLLRRFDVEAVEPLFPPIRRNPELGSRLGLDRYRVVRTGRATDIHAAVAAFMGLPEVESAEPDYIVTAADGSAAGLLPSDPLFPYQWALQNTGSNPIPLQKTAGADIKAVPAWDVATGDPGVLVAVLDSGLRLDHPEFAGRVWTNEGEIPGNYLDDDGNGYIDDVHGMDFANSDGDPSDDQGHGTAVAGVLAAKGNNGSLVAGVDWSCRVVPVKVLNSANSGLYSWWASGLVFAAEIGARVINMSLVGYASSGALAASVQYAHESGCFIAAAMGNNDTASPSIPASLSECTAVGSTDPQDNRCTISVCGYGSNFGSHISVVAPGTYIAVLSYADPTRYFFGGGTSFATPMVAGLASLLLGQNPALTPDQLRDIIRYSADDQVGLPFQDTPGFDIYYGYGRINCQRALGLAPHVAPPIVSAPAAVSGPEGAALSFDVSAADPDGDAIQTLIADLAALPLGNNATFTVSADHALGHLDWTPGYLDAGSYTVTFTASSPFQGSAATQIDVADVNDPPVLVAPRDLAALEGLEMVADVSAGDPDGDPITYLAAEPLPAGATFETSPDRTTGRFLWTPGYDQQGSYSVRFVARSASVSPALTLETSVEAGIVVLDVDRIPVVTLPARVDGLEGEPVTIRVSVTDPDGDPLVGLRAEPLPQGAAFTAAPDFASGLLEWTPGFAQDGSYLVTVTATSEHQPDPGRNPLAAEGSALVQILIADAPDHPPTITAPAEVSGVEGAPLSVQVTFFDVDGDDILSVGASPLPAGAAFTPDAQNTSAILAWTPDFDQAGPYSIQLSARSAHRSSPVSEPVPVDAFATLSITVGNTDRPPSVAAPSRVSVPEGEPLSFTVTAGDPDGEAVQSLGMSGAPPGATFAESPSHDAGAFQWLPTYADAGTYEVAFQASNSLTGSASTSLVVENVNRAPVAAPGGPYQGVVNVPIVFDGTASSDPDGAQLTGSAWDFGDLSTGLGLSPSHAYASGGTFPVTLTVSDGELTGSGTTTATVQGVFPARAFPDAQDRVIRLLAAKPTACLRVEPVDRSYENSAVDPATFRLISPGTGAVEAISAIADKPSVSGDTDRNGVEEVAACFSKEDLRRLFERLTGGRRAVPVTLEGSLSTGGILRAGLSLDVVAEGGSLATAFSPSPMRERGSFTVRTGRAGIVSIRLYDTSGRLVRALPSVALAPGAYQEVVFDGRGSDGRALRSGVYFYRAETREGFATGRLVLVR